MALRTDREKCAHLLRRFGLGASEAELDFYLKDGFSGAIDKLLAATGDDAPGVPLEAMRPENQNNIPMPLVQAWWLLKLASSRTPLQDKMSLFWHDHFATSAQKVNGSMLMYRQVETLRKHSLGNFRTLLTAMSKDPAMLFWLDNQFNVRGKPNENFAREVMELFTLGIGHYTEKDIQEAARAFTGWTIRRGGRAIENVKGKLPPSATFAFIRQQHDTGTKTILGNTGAFDGDDVLGILCGNPRTSVYITEKIWNWFVYPEAPKATIEKHAGKFRDSGLEIKALLRSIMEDPEFYSDKAERAVYKNPVDFCVATVRQLGLGETMVGQGFRPEDTFPRTRMAPVAACQQAMKSMGMDLLFPPDVAGWDGGPAWVTSATMVERIQWADRMFPLQAPAGAGNVRSRKAVFNYPIFGLIASNPTPENLADKLISLFDANVPESKRKAMVAAAAKQGATLNQRTATVAANAVARLIFGSPEFQFV